MTVVAGFYPAEGLESRDQGEERFGTPLRPHHPENDQEYSLWKREIKRRIDEKISQRSETPMATRPRVEIECRSVVSTAHTSPFLSVAL